MTSYRRALSTVLYVCALLCLLVATVLALKAMAGGFGMGLLFIAGIALLIVAINTDEDL